MHVGENSIHVSEVFTVEGNVDYGTGNLDVSGDIEIKGNVGSGFEVRSGGNVLIGGMVEPGAYVFSKGDIEITQGIIGKTTKVVTHGNLITKLVQESTVLSGASIEIAAYVYNANLRADKRVVVLQGAGKGGGSIVGGRTCATEGIDTKIAGSTGGAKTELSIEMPLSVQMRLDQSDKQIEQWELRTKNLCTSLGITEVNKEIITRKLREAGDRKSQVKNEIEQILKMKNMIKQSLSAALELREHYEPLAKNGIISITDKVNEGVIVRIANLYREIESETKGQKFEYNSMDNRPE